MFLELWKESIESIYQNRRRVFLVSLGIAVSVALIMVIFSISGVLENVLEEYMKSKYPSMNMISCAISEKEITKEQLSNIEKALPEDCNGIITKTKDIIKVNGADENHGRLQLLGVNTLYLPGMQKEIVCGRNFMQCDFSKEHAPIILSEEIAKKYYGTSNNALHQEMSVICEDGRKIDLYIVGVYRDKVNQKEDTVLCTEELSRRIQNKKDALSYTNFQIYMHDMSNLKTTENKIKQLIEKETGLKEENILLMAAAMQEGDKSLVSMFTSLFLVVAIISFAVAGIGIMNVMLVTVKRKTYEIGVKKAMGEKRKWILIQIILETMMICCIGEIIGVVLGIFLIYDALPFVANKILYLLQEVPFVSSLQNHLSFQVPIKAVWISIVYCLLVSVIFGFLPAKKAANQNIVDALTKGRT